MSKKNKILVAFAAIYTIWGSTYLGIRVALDTLPPLLMAGGRFVLAGGLLYVLARRRGASRPTPANWKATAMVGALLFLVGNGVLSWAVQYLLTHVAALLVAAGALWLVLLDWLGRRGPRPGLRVIVGLVLGLAGVALLVGPARLAGSERVDVVATVALVLGSVSWAAGSIFSRKMEIPDSSLLAAAMEMLVGGVLLLLAGWLIGESSRLNLRAVSLSSIAAFFYLALFGSLIGFSAYNWLLGVTSSARLSTHCYVNPLVAVFLGWLVLGEALTLRTLLAAAVIVSGVAVIISDRARTIVPGSEEIH